MTAEPMHSSELGALLNALLEGERAGAKTLRAYLDELPERSAARERIRSIQLDEASNCLDLLGLLRSIGVEPSLRTGEFHAKAISLDDWRDRLEFLNRGQRWVARRIAEALPRIDSEEVKRVLSAMHDSHLDNIAACEELLLNPAFAPSAAQRADETRSAPSG